MDQGSPQRALPELPAQAARSPYYTREGSPGRSGTRRSFHSTHSSLSRDGSVSPSRSPNPYARSPTVSPTRMPLRRFDIHETAHGSPLGSPVRRLDFIPQQNDFVTFSDDEESLNTRSMSSVSPRRTLPTLPVPNMPPNLDAGPFDDAASVISERTIANDHEFDQKQESLRSSFNEDIEDYDGESIADGETISSGDVDEVPEAQPRRNKEFSRKEVQLVRGNLVLDCPVPTKLYSFLPRRDSDEFVYMRYSAVTADPDDFADSGFTIRPAIYERDTELCVCITMYNEDEILFTRTLHAVFKNIAYLCQRTKSKVWGPDAWKRIVVTIVADGRTKVNPRVLDCLAAMGVYQDGVAKNFVNGQEVQAHLFEYTAQVSLTPEMRFQGAEKHIVPVQMIFCLKERNKKKINSHRWFLNALCPQLNPNTVVLLDVGTRPTTKTLYHLWKAFDEDSNVGGACGEIKTMTGKFGKSLLNPLVAAQNFEYKISNILDKPLESAFGYISVLPGALSAYRWRALENNPDGTGPLASYFKGEKLDNSSAGIFEKNMYLAEDRILCWELVAKYNEKWVLKYVKDAKGETDVPESLPEFISQRRRWLNGALFAAIYSQSHFRQIWYTDHSTVRKFFLHIEFIYQFLQLVFTFFSLANFYLAFYFVAGSVAGKNAAAIPHGAGLALFLIFKYLCIVTICAQFVLSLGNRPQGAKGLFTASVISLSCVTAYVTVVGLYFVIQTFLVGPSEKDGIRVMLTLVVSLVSTYGIYMLMSFLYLDPWHVFTSALQYFLLLPGYVCTLQIYAFCNTHDVTWGTKGDNEQKLDLGEAVVKKTAGESDVVEVEMPSEQVDIDTGYENALHSLREKAPVAEDKPSINTVQLDYFREIRSRVVLIWMTANLLLVMLVTQFFSLDNPGRNIYLQIILWSMAVFAAFRALGSFVFLLQHVTRKLHKTHHHTTVQWQKVIGKKEPEDAS